MFGKKKRWHLIKGQEPTEMDKKVMYWENKGKLVPTRDLIKTPEQIEGIRKSGVVNTGVLDEVAKHIRQACQHSKSTRYAETTAKPTEPHQHAWDTRATP